MYLQKSRGGELKTSIIRRERIASDKKPVTRAASRNGRLIARERAAESCATFRRVLLTAYRDLLALVGQITDRKNSRLQTAKRSSCRRLPQSAERCFG